MHARLWLLKTWGLVRRERAENYLLVVLLSFAASVSITRLFLTMTGYPQVGGGELHIAHVLWGGLLLFVAALLPLILANRRVYGLSAGLAGVGVGLFIDEVGKFITQRNDYFYPAAAPIIYIFFLMTVWVFLQIRRSPVSDAHSELCRAMEVIQEMLHHTLRVEERTTLEMRLEHVANSTQSDLHGNLANALLHFVRCDERPLPQGQQNGLFRAVYRANGAITRWVTDRRLRIVLVLGLLCLGCLAMKNPAFTFLSTRIPLLADALLLDVHLGRQVEAAVAPRLFQMRVNFELVVGVLLLVASGFLATGRTRLGITIGYLGLLLSLTSVDPLVFYFEQFSTINITVIQFLLLILLLYYRSRYLKGLSLTPAYLEAIGREIGLVAAGENPGSQDTVVTQ